MGTFYKIEFIPRTLLHEIAKTPSHSALFVGSILYRQNSKKHTHKGTKQSAISNLLHTCLLPASPRLDN